MYNNKMSAHKWCVLYFNEVINRLDYLTALGKGQTAVPRAAIRFYCIVSSVQNKQDL